MKQKEILSFLDQVPLRKYKIKMGFKLREAWLINGIFFISESWHSVSKKDIEHLENVDEALIRGILGGLCSKPL